MVEVSPETKEKLEKLINRLEELENKKEKEGYRNLNLYKYLTSYTGEYTTITNELLDIFKEIYPDVKSIADVQRKIGMPEDYVDGKFGSRSLRYLEEFNKGLEIKSTQEPQQKPDFSQQAAGLKSEQATELLRQFESGLKAAADQLFKRYGIGKKDREKVLDIIGKELKDVIIPQINILIASNTLTQENVKEILNSSMENIEREVSEYLGKRLTKREKDFWNRLSLISAGIVALSLFGALCIMMPGAIITAPTITAFANLSQTILGSLGLAGMGTTIGAAITGVAALITTIFSGIKSRLTGSKLDDYTDQVRGCMDRFNNDLKNPQQKQQSIPT